MLELILRRPIKNPQQTSRERNKIKQINHKEKPPIILLLFCMQTILYNLIYDKHAHQQSK